MKGNTRTVLVTGGTGFLGSHAVPALQAAGWRVRLALRTPVVRTDCETALVGSIGGTTDWRAALAGVDAVLHMAARVHRSAAVQAQDSDAYRETNTAGTLRLAEAAAAGDIEHLVFLSSIMVHGATSRERLLHETDPFVPATVYATSKAGAEDGLAHVSARTSLPVTILRPPLVYGRGARANFALLTRAVRAGAPLPFGLVRNTRSFVAAENLASFIVGRLEKPGAGAEAFLVADDESVSTPGFIRLLGQALNRPARLLPIPPAAMRLAFKLGGKASLGDSLLGSLAADTAKARATGWRPPLTLAEGLRRAVDAERT